MKNWNDMLPETPSGFHNRVEMTLAGLEEREMKKIFARTPLMVFAIIAVMLAATAFAATQFFGGFVDWDGNLIPVEEPLVKGTPEPGEIDDFEDYGKILSNVPAGENWTIWDNGSGTGSYGPIGEEVRTPEDVAAHFEGRKLLIARPPEGFDTMSAELNYNLHDVSAYEYSKETLNNGAQLVKSRLRPLTDEDIDGYNMFFHDGKNYRINVFAHIHVAENYEDGVTYEFFIEEGDEYEAIDIPGFDRAMVIRQPDGTMDISIQKDSEDGRYIFDYSIYTNCDMPADELIGKLFE